MKRNIHAYHNDEFRFNDTSTHEGHLHQNGVLTRFFNETSLMISHICIKYKTRTNLKNKSYIFLKRLMLFRNISVLSADTSSNK